jgi:hypothetical protein
MDYEQIATNSIERALREMAKLSYENAETIKAWADAKDVPGYVTGDDDPAMEAAIIAHWIMYDGESADEHVADVWDCARRAAEVSGNTAAAHHAATMKRICELANEAPDERTRNEARDAVRTFEKAEAAKREARVANARAKAAQAIADDLEIRAEFAIENLGTALRNEIPENN